jgi:hypothetical protein
MCIVPGPASQDAVFKREYASSGLPCRFHSTVLYKASFVYTLPAAQPALSSQQFHAAVKGPPLSILLGMDFECTNQGSHKISQMYKIAISYHIKCQFINACKKWIKCIFKSLTLNYITLKEVMMFNV